MSTFIIILILYIIIMYNNIKKIKKNDIEVIRFRDQIARFTFLQISFALYDYTQNRFDLITFLNKVMISHIGVTSFIYVKEYIDKIRVV